MLKVLEGLDKSIDKQGNTVYIVTPAWVKSLNLLGNDPKGFNRNNRRYDDQKASDYARLITSGKWNYLVGELHIVDQPDQPEHHGRLVSGQHRLMGILKSNVAVPVRFTGIPLEAALHVDTGRSRSYGQNVAMFIDASYQLDVNAVTNAVSIVEYLITGKYRTHTGASNITRILGQQVFFSVRTKWKPHFENVRNLGVPVNYNKNIVKAFIAVLYAGNAPGNFIDLFIQTVLLNKGDEYIQDRMRSYSDRQKSASSLMILLCEIWNHICTDSFEQGVIIKLPHINAVDLAKELEIPINQLSGVSKGRRKKKLT